MKKVFIIILGILLSGIIKSQNSSDAYRYSDFNYTGTARFNSMGGAFGAIGADFSNISTNPAGLGLFIKNDFTFSASLFNGSTKSNYLGNSYRDDKYNINISNFGAVFTKKMNPKGDNEGKGWRSFQFALGFTRLANFNSRQYIEGFNNRTSIMTDYVINANNDGFKPDNLNPNDTYLAYDTYLINPNNVDSLTYTSPLYTGGMLQKKSTAYSGSGNEFSLALSSNFDDKFYFGGSIGVPYFRYKENSLYSETDIKANIQDVKYFDIKDKLSDDGVGVNVKLGMIYRATDWFRLGLAIHSPSFYYVNRSFERSIHSELDNGQVYDRQTVTTSTDYYLETPLRAIGSLGFIIAKYGLIDIDCEYIDYTQMKLRDDNGDVNQFVEENNYIQNNYSKQLKFRVGGELNFGLVSFRAGHTFAMLDPFNNYAISDNNSTSFGFGFRGKMHYIDFAYVISNNKESYYLYSPSLVEPSSNKLMNNSIVLTMGLKF